MRWVSFLIVVALQILAFQFLSGTLTRALPDYFVGNADLPAATAARIASFKTRAGRLRRGIGVILLLIAAVIAFLYHGDIHRKLVALALVSFASTATLLVSYLHDRRSMASMAADLPQSQRRLASLEKRSLSQHYLPAWEALPALLLAVTLALAVLGSAKPGGRAGDLWILPVIQTVSLVILLGLTFRNIHTGSCYSPHVREFSGPPEQLLALERAILTLELRYLLAVRIGMGLWGSMTEVGRYVALTGARSGSILLYLAWVPLAGLLALLPVYGVNASRISRRFSNPVRPSRPAETGNGGSRS